MDLFQKVSSFTRPDQLRHSGLYPYFRSIRETHGATRVVIDGEELVMAGSNNYLGLTHDPRVLDACHEAVQHYGSGCTGSRFLNGTLELHEQLESRLAAFFKKDACITSSTGFQAILGAIPPLAGRKDAIFGDRHNHASIIDGCRLSAAPHHRFHHNDVDDLRRQLQRCEVSPEGGRLIITEGVFSSLGDIAPLPEIVELTKQYGARLMIDDAHGVGVLGEGGRGAAEHFDLLDDVDLIVGTFSKSFAGLGGFVVGPTHVVDYVKHTSRSVMFSASMPPANVAAALACLDIIENEPERRERLRQIVVKMQKGFEELGFNVIGGDGAILSIVIGEEQDALEFNRQLLSEGVFVNAFIPPSVPPNMSLLRTSYSAAHSEEDLAAILAAFDKVSDRLGFGKSKHPTKVYVP